MPLAPRRTGKPIGDVWAAPLDIRLRRISPHPDDRRASRVDAQLLKRDEEQRLVLAVQRADAESADVVAGEAHQSITKYLELMCDELAGNEKERLAAVVPGIVEAYYWPHEVPNQRVS